MNNEAIYIKTILERLLGGDPTIQDSEKIECSRIGNIFLTNPNLIIPNQTLVLDLLNIANIVYNNIGGDPIIPDDI
jgi:hypothetical protein